MSKSKKQPPVVKKELLKEQTDFSIFENFTEGFYALDEKWHYIYVNKKGAQLAQKMRTRRG